MSSSNLLPSVVVRYSRRGQELFWCGSASRDASDGPAAAKDLLRQFCEAAGRPSSDSTRLCVVPARPGGTPTAVAPVLGQSLSAFLEHTCRNDDGAFQLRAEFGAASDNTCVLVRVAFPGTVPTPAAGGSGSSEGEGSVPQMQPMIVEQFELQAASPCSSIATLKGLIHLRTGFPVSQLVLLLDWRRLHDGLPMSRVAAVADSRGVPLQCHLAASGAYVFLRREGLGHRVPTQGPCTLMLHLPEVVQGSRVRPVTFDLSQTLDDFKLSVQAVSGLPPASLEFKLAKCSEALEAVPRSPDAVAAEMYKGKGGNASLKALGFTDGCALHVTSSVGKGVLTKSDDIPLDVPTVGNPSLLYDRVAERLGIPDASCIALFSGTAPIRQDGDLSNAPLADGSVVGTYISCPFQLPFSVVSRIFAPGEAPGASSASSAPCATSASSASGDNATSLQSFTTESVTASGDCFPTVQCFSTDTIDEVRERIVRICAANTIDKSPEHAARIRGSKIFVADPGAWLSSGATCNSIAALAEILGHLIPCSENVRLSRLGIAEGLAHLVLVPEQKFLVEIEVHHASEVVVTQKVRVPGILRLSEVGKALERELQDSAPPASVLLSRSAIKWALGISDAPSSSQGSAPDRETPVRAFRAASPRLSVVAAMSSAAAAVVATGKRKSFGGSPDSETPSKRRSLSSTQLQALSEDDFVSDVYAIHCGSTMDLPSQFLCPISIDVMRDPVVVSGSGNTYDRKSIERHFQMKHTDPISNTELRRASERRLVPNNALRSQVDEAERSQVDLRLVALLGELPKGSSRVEGGMSAWFKSTFKCLV